MINTTLRFFNWPAFHGNHTSYTRPREGHSWKTLQIAAARFFTVRLPLSTPTGTSRWQCKSTDDRTTTILLLNINNVSTSKRHRRRHHITNTQSTVTSDNHLSITICTRNWQKSAILICKWLGCTQESSSTNNVQCSTLYCRNIRSDTNTNPYT